MKLLNLGCGSHFSTNPVWTNVDMHGTGPGVLAHDLYQPLPFGDGEFDAVYHSDVLEHLNRRCVPGFLSECWRVLKPGGTIRVATPDLERQAMVYLDVLAAALAGDALARERYEWIVTEMLDQLTRHRPGGEMLNYWKRDPVLAYDFVLARVGSEAERAIASMRKRGAQPDPPQLLPEERDALAVGRFRLSGECHMWLYDRYSLGELLRGAGFVDVCVCRADQSCVPDFNAYLLDVEMGGGTRKPDNFFMEGMKP
jgi:predicted SAM-dependent methyltransferase